MNRNLLGTAVVSNLKGRLSMRLPWMDQYSNIGADRDILSNLKYLDKDNSINQIENMSDPDMEGLSLVMDKKSAAKSMIS